MSKPSLRETVEELSQVREADPGNVPLLLQLLQTVHTVALTAERPAEAASARILLESIESGLRNKSAPRRIEAILDSGIERLRRRCPA